MIAMDDSSLAPDLRAEVAATDGTAVRPGPLDLHDIREIAGSYIGASADALPASSSSPPVASCAGSTVR